MSVGLGSTIEEVLKEINSYAESGGGSISLDPIVKGQTKLAKNTELTIEPNKIYFVQCFDTQGNISYLQIMGGNRHMKAGKFAIVLSGSVDENLVILQTGSVIISNLVITGVRAIAIKPQSPDDYLAYYEIGGYASLKKR